MKKEKQNKSAFGHGCHQFTHQRVFCIRPHLQKGSPRRMFGKCSNCGMSGNRYTKCFKELFCIKDIWNQLVQLFCTSMFIGINVLIFSHDIGKEGELVLKIGEIIIISKKNINGWWFGYKENKITVQGYFSSNNVKLLNFFDEFNGEFLKNFKIFKSLSP